MSPNLESSNTHCANCGNALHCEVQAGEKTCWCFALPNVLPLPETSGACLCRACLDAEIEKAKSMLNLGQEDKREI